MRIVDRARAKRGHRLMRGLRGCCYLGISLSSRASGVVRYAAASRQRMVSTVCSNLFVVANQIEIRRGLLRAHARLSFGVGSKAERITFDSLVLELLSSTSTRAIENQLSLLHHIVSGCAPFLFIS